MATSLPRATILNTEMRNIHSTIMGDNYQISIWFPMEYPKPGYKYPVIYLTDPEVLLGQTILMVDCFSAAQLMPSCLIVGVGHDVSTYDEWVAAREIDLLPWPDSTRPPHRAADFLSFIKNELIPLIDTTYPVDPADRCLLGYSWGAVFTLYTLLHEPELFKKYYIGDGIAEDFLPLYLDYEQKLAEQRKSLPVHAFFSISGIGGGHEAFHQIIEALKRPNYEGFRLETLVVEGETHVSGLPLAFIHGLRALYKPK